MIAFITLKSSLPWLVVYVVFFWCGSQTKSLSQKIVQMELIKFRWSIYLTCSKICPKLVLLHVCAMTNSCVSRDSFLCVTYMADSFVWDNSFICVTRLIHVWGTTYSSMWYDWSIYAMQMDLCTFKMKIQKIQTKFQNMCNTDGSPLFQNSATTTTTFRSLSSSSSPWDSPLWLCWYHLSVCFPATCRNTLQHIATHWWDYDGFMSVCIYATCCNTV